MPQSPIKANHEFAGCKRWGARPPRALFGAPPRRTPDPGDEPFGWVSRRNANGEDAVGGARGGRAPRSRLNRSGRSSILSLFVRFFASAHTILMKTNGHRRRTAASLRAKPLGKCVHRAGAAAH